jgi:hypothetical protein
MILPCVRRLKPGGQPTFAATRVNRTVSDGQRNREIRGADAQTAFRSSAAAE